MAQQTRALRTFSILIGLLCSIYSAVAQQKAIPLDPSGVVKKFNKNFNGIGPQLYFLPPPRSKQELLTDYYSEKASFQDSIVRALDFQRLLADYKVVGNQKELILQFQPFPTDDLAWNTLINTQLAEDQINTAYGLLNNYAQYLLVHQKPQLAIQTLQTALVNAQKSANSPDITSIQANLSRIFLFERNMERAGFFQEANYKEALSNKQLKEQANSLVQIAMIQAIDKDYKSAENTIIRRAIPLFNKIKAYDGKLLALEQLARIYHLQNKHIEAQWFLIQARDIAVAKKLYDDLAEIEYLLALSKHLQQNSKVAKQEFINANGLAKKENNRLLQLAILDKLGEIYLQQADLSNAQATLDQYYKLREELFTK